MASFVQNHFQALDMNSSCAMWKPDFVLLYTVPVLLESILFKVRLKYHFPLNLLLISLVLFPWLETGVTDLSMSDYLVNVAAVVVIPACFISLYQTRMQKIFEQGL